MKVHELKTLVVGDRVVIADTAMPAVVHQIGTKGLWIHQRGQDTTPFYRWADARKLRVAVVEGFDSKAR